MVLGQFSDIYGPWPVFWYLWSLASFLIFMVLGQFSDIYGPWPVFWYLWSLASFLIFAIRNYQKNGQGPKGYGSAATELWPLESQLYSCKMQQIVIFISLENYSSWALFLYLKQNHSVILKGINEQSIGTWETICTCINSFCIVCKTTVSFWNTGF